ncbi:hypothetical protein [Spiroplasma endosymbiont of Phyllotreta cruciferae]|uniref:hypothetical protein n=1 Tax=Spiroplasma endosymbiont of Phyllotreta cruciferae TaxID=2886375 RepID=UPI0020A032F1|nr:hypothetical protein [Spiroplasma endosymbiont of Phyllotreta cruciferae]
MENNLSNLLFITVEDVKASKLWQPINDRKQSAYNYNLIYNAILKTSLWMDRLSGGTISDKINKKYLFPWVKKDNTGLIEYDKWLSYIQSACLLAVINWYLPKGVNDLTGSASFSQGGVAYSQTNDPEANENITCDVKNALKLAGEIIDIISSKTVSRPYNYSLDNYAHPWEEEYKHISKKTFYPTLLFWLKERLQTDNSINITYPTINDFSKIDYNEYIKLIVPFDNDTIYYENNVWKTKQSGQSQNLHIVIGESGRANADYDKQTGGLRIWDSSFKNNDQVADFSVIKTKKTPGLEATDDTLPTTKYINEHYQLKGGGGNDWEVVDTNDFVPDTISEYKIRNFDKSKYVYKIWANIEQYPILMVETFKNYSEDIHSHSQITLFIKKNGNVLMWLNNSPYNMSILHIERKKVS